MSRESENVEEKRDESEDPARVSHLQRRALQAPVAACLIREFAKAFGHEKTLALAAKAIEEDARNSGRALAEKMGGNGLSELKRVVREVWSEDGAVSIRVLADSENRFDFNVTRCRYAEMYAAQGMKDLGFCLSCTRDGAFAEGFNPRLRFSRTQTLMEGAAHCDFRFALDP